MIRELPTGHWPMLSAPQELAALLRELADIHKRGNSNECGIRDNRVAH